MLRRPAALMISVIAAVVAVLAGCARDQAPPPADPALYQNLARPDAKLDAVAAQSMISSFRNNNGLGPVTIDPELMRFARQQATAMAAHNKMDHDVLAPFPDRIRKWGLGGSVAVENIAAGDHTLAEAFSSWRGSPQHRANMLNRSVTRMGVAAAYAPASKYKIYWELVLAGPDRHHG